MSSPHSALYSHLHTEGIVRHRVDVDTDGGESLQLVGGRHGEDGQVRHVEDVEAAVSHHQHSVDGRGGVEESDLGTAGHDRARYEGGCETLQAVRTCYLRHSVLQ